MFDLEIHGLVFSRTLSPRWVYIRDGKIAEVSSEKKSHADTEIELEPGDLLLPAATDLHVHLRDWRQASKEDVASGTMSALAGGVTTIAEMPNTDPRIDSAEMVLRRIELLRRQSYVDFAVHSGVPEDPREVPKLRKAGAFAVKFYPSDLGRFREVSRLAQDQGLKTVVHAEDASLIGKNDEDAAERTALKKLVPELRPDSDVRFAHVSTSFAVRTLRSRRRPNVTLEATPHHLFMDRELAESRIGSARFVRPPLRDAKNVRQMLGFLRNGLIDFYATDHAPHTAREKRSVPPSPGFPGLEIAYPLVLTKTDDVALSCKVFCENPARYLGMRKGFISRGHIADLVVMRRKRWTVDSAKFVSKGRVTPFQGEPLGYSVVKVIKAGDLVLDRGKPRRSEASLVGQGVKAAA